MHVTNTVPSISKGNQSSILAHFDNVLPLRKFQQASRVPVLAIQLGGQMMSAICMASCRHTGEMHGLRILGAYGAIWSACLPCMYRQRVGEHSVGQMPRFPVHVKYG